MEKAGIKLSDHFDYGRLLKFTIPSILMMVISSVYSIVDGLFISNYAGSDAFAAVNLVMPVTMLLSCVGSITFAECIAAIITGVVLANNRKGYGYY